MIHELKTTPKYFKEVADGNKTFEVRKADRPFRVGDFLALNEYDSGYYTDNCILAEVTYILREAEFCKKGFVILGIKSCEINKQNPYDSKATIYKSK